MARIWLLLVACMAALPCAGAQLQLPGPARIAGPDIDWGGAYLGLRGSYSNDGAAHGALLVGAAGYQWPVGHFVLGIEAEAGWAGLRAGTSRIDWLGSLKGRAGFAMDRSLLFVSAGAAAASDGEALLPGWSLGVGADVAVTEVMSLRAEYGLYALATRGNAVPIDLQVARLGVNWHF